MPSLEMLRKLLDEFTEKEAHTREEINVITEQITELEKRIIASQTKLSTVATDREKVRAMQARYSGGSTLTTSAGSSSSTAVGASSNTFMGSPLDASAGSALGTSIGSSNPSVGASSVGSASVGSASSLQSSFPGQSSESSQDFAEDGKERESRPRPGRAARDSSTNIPAMPMNVRASQTRIPAMTPPDPASLPGSVPPAIQPLTSNPLFAVEPSAAQPAQPAAKAFSPMDLFGSPAEEPAPSEPAVQQPAYSEPASAPQTDYTFGTPGYDFGSTPQPTEQNPLGAPNTTPIPAQIPTPAPQASTGTSQVGEITTSFFTPMGSTEAALQPSVPPQQPASALPTDLSQGSSSPFLTPDTTAQAAPPADDSAQVSDLEDEPDDTVKSINDALRGLFR